jgi:hypothetical protein
LFLDTEEQKKNFKENPEEYLKYRKLVEGELNQRLKFVRPGVLNMTSIDFE